DGERSHEHGASAMSISPDAHHPPAIPAIADSASVRHRMAIRPWLRTATGRALRCKPAVPKGNGPVSDDPDSGDKPRSGRVRHDSGGRAIWEWALDSGKHAVDSTSRLLKKLELTGITLMGDEARPWEKQKQSDAARKP